MGGERRAQNPPVLQQSLRVAFGAQLVQELGRALHVGEEEGDGSGRKIAPHTGIMNADYYWSARRPP